jgi:hypothetical protein
MADGRRPPLRERLAEMQAREQSATPGPWQVGTNDDDAVDSHWVYDAGWFEVADVRTPHDEVSGDAVRDARFIAHARQDVPALLAAVEAVLDQLDQAARAAATDVRADPDGEVNVGYSDGVGHAEHIARQAIANALGAEVA